MATKEANVQVPPDLGSERVTVAKWLKKPGDIVREDDLLVELESDKATVEVVAHVSGRLNALNVAEGSTIEAGGVLATIQSEVGDVIDTDSVGEADEMLSPEDWHQIKVEAIKLIAAEWIDQPDAHLAYVRSRIAAKDLPRAERG